MQAGRQARQAGRQHLASEASDDALPARPGSATEALRRLAPGSHQNLEERNEQLIGAERLAEGPPVRTSPPPGPGQLPEEARQRVQVAVGEDVDLDPREAAAAAA
jgi:hypothetical protein